MPRASTCKPEASPSPPSTASGVFTPETIPHGPSRISTIRNGLLLRSDGAWSQQCYKNYGGFAWYRFTVVVPDGSKDWSIYLGPMETGYQLFVDGRLAGSFGPILNALNYAQSSRAFAISPAASGPHMFHIAIRAWHAPDWADYAPGGFVGSSYFGDSFALWRNRAATGLIASVERARR